MTPREVLLRAADHMEKYGWRQRRRGMRGEPCCAIGAIAAVLSDAGLDYTLELELALQAGAMLTRHVRVGFIADWNDEPGRTAAEVIWTLRRAAEATGTRT